MVQWKDSFWSIKLRSVHRPEMTGQVVSGCRWTSFNMYGVKNNIISSFVFDAMCKFYTDHNQTLDYFGQNHFIKVAYDCIPEAGRIIDAIPYSNPNIYKLPDLVYNNSIFDQQIWDELTSDTGAFKITQKRKYIEDINGHETYYGHFKKIYRQQIAD